MIIFMPLAFKEKLRLDDKKHFIINMNGDY